MPVHYLYLALSVLGETLATMSLQASAQFTRLIPTVLVIVGYGLSFYFLALTLKYMPVGITYALASGLGIVAVAAGGLLIFGQRLDWPAIAGIALIVAGLLVINLFSETTVH